MTVYATIDDVIKYRGPQEAKTMDLLEAHLEGCSARLRMFAKKAGLDLDGLYEEDEDIALTVKIGVIDSVMNKLNSNSNNDPLMTQFSQAAGGYSVSGTLANVGGDYYFPKRFLKDLGLLRQTIGTIEVFDYEYAKRTDCNPSREDNTNRD